MHEAGVRGTRFNFVKRLVDFTPREVLAEIAHRIAPLGWHVVVYFEAADLPELWDFFTSLPTTVVVDHMGRPDVAQAGRRPGVRAVRADDARARQHLVEGQLPGAAVASPARRPSTASGTPTGTSSRSPGGWSRRFPTASSGAPTGRTRTSRTTCRTTACWSTGFRTSRTTPELQQQAAGGQPAAALLELTVGVRRIRLRTLRRRVRLRNASARPSYMPLKPTQTD